jgi:hypothetical protein
MEREPGLYWTVKKSFRAYVERLPDGAAVAAYGAVDCGEIFRFPPEIVPVPTAGTDPPQRKFAGEVRFGGHHGMLLVPIKHPAIESVGTVLAVTIEYPWLAPSAMPRVEIARGEATPIDETSDSWRVINLRLTEDGSDLFGGTYKPGEKLDDMEIVDPSSSP